MQPGEEIENLVAELEDTINTAKPAFGGGGQRKIVNAEDVYQIVDDIRAVFPEEVATARRISRRSWLMPRLRQTPSLLTPNSRP